MKRFTQTFILMVLVLGLSVSAQVIPNAGFETWEANLTGGQQPQGWQALMNSSVAANVVEVDGYGGGSAAQLVATEIPGLGVMSPLLISEFFIVDQKYAKLKGYLKSAPQGNDTLYIIVGMYSGNDDLVGAGVAFVKQEISDFTEFSINIFYEGDETPEQCLISFTAGKFDGTATEGSAFVIDELSLSELASVNELSPVFSDVGEAYPSPAISKISIPFELNEPDELEIVIFDVAGRLIYSQAKQLYELGNHEFTVLTDDFQSGTYVYSIVPSDGKSVTGKFMVR